MLRSHCFVGCRKSNARSWLRITCGGLAWLAISAVVGAQERASEPRAPDDLAPPGWAEQLSRKRYAGRQQATLDLWRHRERTRDEVQRAARDPDPEVAGRAQWILRQWRRGALPGTPPEVVRLLRNADDPAAIEELLERGHFEAAVVAVEESMGTVDREMIQRKLSAAITRRFSVFIKTALERDAVADLVRLIDLTATTKEMAVCRVELMGHLGLEVGEDEWLPTAAETWPEEQRDQALVLILSLLEKPEKAFEVARDSGDETLLRICQMLAGRWREMATESLASARAADDASAESVRRWCQVLVAADRSNDLAIFREAAARLASIDIDDRDANDLRWRCLIVHGEIDAGLNILESLQPEEAAVLAMAAARGIRAFDSLGYPWDRVDQDLDDWIDQALASQSAGEAPIKLTADMQSLLALMRCLLSAGRNDAAWTIATRLCDAEIDVLSSRGTITNQLRDYVHSTLNSTTHRDWILRLAERGGEKRFSDTTRFALAYRLPVGDSITLEVLLDSLERLKPQLPFKHRLRTAYQLLSGQPVENFDDADFKRLYDHLSQGANQYQQLLGRQSYRHRVRMSVSTASMFALHGQADLARNCLELLVNRGDLDAILELAQQELDGGSGETAAELYDSLWDRLEGPTLKGRFAGNVNHSVKALVGQWTLARRNGDESQARLLKQLTLTMCSPSPETRSELAGYLGDRGETDLAMEAYRSLLPMVGVRNHRVDQPLSSGVEIRAGERRGGCRSRRSLVRPCGGRDPGIDRVSDDGVRHPSARRSALGFAGCD